MSAPAPPDSLESGVRPRLTCARTTLVSAECVWTSSLGETPGSLLLLLILNTPYTGTIVSVSPGGLGTNAMSTLMTAPATLVRTELPAMMK